MEAERSDYLRVLRVDRAQGIQLVVVGLILALGVDLIAGYLGVHLSGVLALLIGAGTVGLALALALRSVYRPRPRSRRFEGFFIYDRRENALVESHSSYSLSEALARYIEAGLAEDGTIKAIWERNPIALLPERGVKGKGDPRRSLDLVRQACEYFILRSFSMRLSEHFTSGEYDKDELATLSHIDLPDVLLENRFLHTFAEPMEDRAPFPPRERSEGGRDPHVVSQLGGALYERFELVHPKGWRVVRSGGGIEIETKRFLLRVEPRCEGYATNLPPLYLSHYLGLKQELDEKKFRYATLKIDVVIEISPRRTWLTTARGWRYYRWIDRWIADLEPQISMAAHLNEIGFAGAETTLQMLARTRGQIDSSEGKALPRERADGDDATPPAEEPGTRLPFTVGDRVEHLSFGRGQIERVEPGGVVVVRFDKDIQETRKLMADYAPLRPLPSAVEQLDAGG